MNVKTKRKSRKNSKVDKQKSASIGITDESLLYLPSLFNSSLDKCEQVNFNSLRFKWSMPHLPHILRRAVSESQVTVNPLWVSISRSALQVDVHKSCTGTEGRHPGCQMSGFSG